ALLAERQLLAAEIIVLAGPPARTARTAALLLLLREPAADRIDRLWTRRGPAGRRRALGDLDPRRQRDHRADRGPRGIARRLDLAVLGQRLGDAGGAAGTGGPRRLALGGAGARTLEVALELGARVDRRLGALVLDLRPARRHHARRQRRRGRRRRRAL